MQPMYYIGLDVHKQKISYCVKDSTGKLYAMEPTIFSGCCLPHVWHQPVTHLLEIFFVASQIPCQQFLLAKDPQHQQQHLR